MSNMWCLHSSLHPLKRPFHKTAATQSRSVMSLLLPLRSSPMGNLVSANVRARPQAKQQNQSGSSDLAVPHAADKSKVLVVGGATGYIGKYVVEASARLGHPTFALVKDAAPSDPAAAELLERFRNSGVTLVEGDVDARESLAKAVEQVDVVISTLGYEQTQGDNAILEVLREAGNIKRFFPSEFGNDPDHAHPVGPAKAMTAKKAELRRTVEASGVPYTYVSCNFFAGYFLPTLAQVGARGLPTDEVTILGDGNVKAIFVNEEDIATYTIKAVDDPRTKNKTLFVRPSANTLTHNELVSLWEGKVGRTLERVYVPEQEVLKRIEELPLAQSILYCIYYSVFIKGDQTNFEIDPSLGVEATELYPDVRYTTVDEYLNRIL